MVRSDARILLAGLVLDELAGDPARWHPVAGFGRVALVLERATYRPSRRAGVGHVALAVGVPTLTAFAAQRRFGRPASATATVLWTALGGRSLRRTATRLAALVEAGDLAGARALAPSLVSRRPDDLDAAELTRAALESLAENTADAVVGPLLWCVALGTPGVVLHRTANTLDAMVGYRTSRYEEFGWAAARLDDVVNWPVARIAAMGVVLAAPLTGGDARAAARTWRRDGARHPSPNAGRVEAAFAGALGVRLGGASTYGDRVEDRPALGGGRRPTTADVRAAARLSTVSTWAVAAGLALAAWRWGR